MKMWRGTNQEAEVVDAYKPLRETLAEMSATAEALIGRDKLEAPLRAIDELRASGAEQRVLAVGSRAPEFSLVDQHGNEVRSADLLAQGRLV